MAVRPFVAIALLIVSASTVFAQPGASGPVAALNQQARELSETAPEQSLAAAVKAYEAVLAAGKAADVPVKTVAAGA